MTGKFRKGIGAIVLNEKKQIFLGQRIDSPSAWQLPQGGIDQNENPFQALKREMREEIGTDQFEVLAESKQWHSYTLPDEMLRKIKNFWGEGVVGQTQLWFLCMIKNTSLINLKTEHAEFSNFKWSNAYDVMEHCIEFKKPIYEAVLREFDLF